MFKRNLLFVWFAVSPVLLLTQIDALAQPQSSAVAQNTSAELEKDIKALRALQNSRELDFETVRKFVDQTNQKWERDPVNSLPLLIVICRGLTSWNFAADGKKQALKLAAEYANTALKRKDISPEFKANFVTCLLPQEFSTLDAATVQTLPLFRLGEAKKWVDVIQTLEADFDPTFDPEDPNNWPKLTVLPPAGSGIPLLGASPEAIKDPELRRQYEEAIKQNAAKYPKLRQQRLIRSSLKMLLPLAQTFLINAYKREPRNVEELSNMLAPIKDEEFKQKVLTQVTQKPTDQNPQVLTDPIKTQK